MIRKLQIKFVIINMTIVSIMLFVIFGLVYQFTQRNLENESIRMMKSIAANPFQLGSPGDSPSNLRLPFFALQIGIWGDLIATGGGYYDLSDLDFLEELIRESLESNQEIGIIEEHNLRYYRVTVPMGTILVFSDMSSEKHTLHNLVRTSAIIAFFSFVVFLGISMLLARWAVRPVAKAWKQQKQFIADASHELKTPLTVIMTNAELLQSPDYSEEEHTYFLQSISLMSEQMKQLVEKMLLLARSDNQQTSLAMHPVNLSKVALDCEISFEGVFADRGLSLESYVEPDIVVRGNEDELRQVIDILLDNAQKYSSANTTTHLTLSNKEHNKCCLRVSNPGEPIPPEELKNIFQRFYRMDRARERDGSFGLGLSIAETIIAKHRGRIWAESQNGVNSFLVELGKCGRRLL